MPVVNNFTGLLSDASWLGQTAQPGAVFITYSFDRAPQSYLSEGGFNATFRNTFQAFNDADKAMARTALNQWANASGIVFLEVPPGQGDMRFVKYNFDTDANVSDAAAFAYYPTREVDGDGASNPFKLGGDVFVNTSVKNSVGLLLHEIGHALGFKHPHEGPTTLGSLTDNTNYTVMSYNGALPPTIKPLDIEAVRYRYGTTDATHLSSWNWNAAATTLTQTGRSGNETILGVAVRDVINAGAGNDLAAGFEGHDRLFGQDGDDKLFGNEGNDFLSGGAGNDTLRGDGGNDTFLGGAGNDRLLGDFNGGDIASFSDATAGVTVDLQGVAVSGTVFQAFGAGSGHDMLSGIRNISGSGFDDNLSADDLANRLNGGAGADRMAGRGGNDTYVVDSAGDTIVEVAGEGRDIVWSSLVDIDLRGFANVEDATLSGNRALSLSGNGLANVLTGNSARNIIDGGGGADTMIGGTGNDTYRVDTVNDRITERSGGGIDTIETLVSYSLLSRAELAQIENLTAIGDAALTISGNAVANVLIGNGADNVLAGGGGNDILVGRDGDDTLRGGAGRDRLTGGAGSDIFDFNTLAESPATVTGRDVIVDFTQLDDRIDLSTIDANGAAGGAPEFSFIGMTAFTGRAGELKFGFVNPAGTASDRTIVAADINGDRIADFQVELVGLISLTAADFLL